MAKPNVLPAKEFVRGTLWILSWVCPLVKLFDPDTNCD